MKRGNDKKSEYTVHNAVRNLISQKQPPQRTAEKMKEKDIFGFLSILYKYIINLIFAGYEIIAPKNNTDK